MRFARGDMRDHIVSHKNDHGASYWRYGILRWRSWLKINICEIFGVVRFSTFATISALFGHTAVVALCPLLGAERKTYAPIELFSFLTQPGHQANRPQERNCLRSIRH
jgi:hypothetical protein